MTQRKIFRKEQKSRFVRKFRIRKKISGTRERPRLSVFKSNKHIYVQIVNDDTGNTLVSASTVERDISQKLSSAESAEKPGYSIKSKKSVDTAKLIGSLLAKRCIDKNIRSIVFDRNGYRYTGRIKAVADGAREGGLDF
jgi:large subunit ribosomal protein L18